MALALFFGAAVLFAVPRMQGGLVLTMACFVGAAASVALVQPSLWALRPLLVSEATSGGIALIYGMGSLGGAFGLSMMGHMKIATGSYSRGLTLLATVMSLAAVVVFLLGLGKERQSRPNPTRHAPPSAV
jgi:nitrate/nitrite transporter NarK